MNARQILIAIVTLAACGCQSFGPSAEPAPQSEVEATPAPSAGLRQHPNAPTRPVQLADDEEAGAPIVRSNKLDSPIAMRGDILMVNDMSLPVSEVLFALRREIAKVGPNPSPSVANALAERIAGQVQFEVGSMLLYQEALRTLNEQQQAALEATAKRALDDEVNREHGGSIARFEKELAGHDLTIAGYRDRLQRQLLVRSYTREKIRPQVSLRRNELLSYYRANRDKFSEPETRELLMIEAPYSAFLPEGERWETAGKTKQAKAKLAARRHIRKAHEALPGRDFRDIARQYSRSPRAEQGGSWGELGSPLKAPFDALSQWAFSHGSNQASGPIELDQGWYIACCGQITPRKTFSFAESQDRIRDEIVNERADVLAGEYVRTLAGKATISDLGGFVRRAIERALDLS